MTLTLLTFLLYFVRFSVRELRAVMGRLDNGHTDGLQYRMQSVVHSLSNNDALHHVNFFAKLIPCI